MRDVLRFLNLIVSLASAVAAVLALTRPGSLSGSSNVEGGEMFYVRMYAARSVPFGLTAAILPFLCRGKAVAAVLFTAATIQTIDVTLAAQNKNRGMMIGGSVGAMVHLVCGAAIILRKSGLARRSERDETELRITTADTPAIEFT